MVGQQSVLLPIDALRHVFSTNDLHESSRLQSQACYLGDLCTQMAGRSLDNLWFGPPTCNFKGHERNTLQGSPIAGITELIDRTSVVGATGVRSAVITSTEHLIHIPCAVSPYLFPIFVRGNRIHRLFQLRFWTLWNLLRYYNFN